MIAAAATAMLDGLEGRSELPSPPSRPSPAQPSPRSPYMDVATHACSVRATVGLTRQPTSSSSTCAAATEL